MQYGRVIAVTHTACNFWVTEVLQFLEEIHCDPPCLDERLGAVAGKQMLHGDAEILCRVADDRFRSHGRPCDNRTFIRGQRQKIWKIDRWFRLWRRDRRRFGRRRSHNWFWRRVPCRSHHFEAECQHSTRTEAYVRRRLAIVDDGKEIH